MRLKTITIKGFKSFANETIINFNEDVIGIVGPNGSGKSNVIDAIRWVLGEQKSKELRLEKMTNVIFNGTKKKKQGGRASVSLTFENTKNLLPVEYNTVTISRTLFRSGESEYKLNDVKCRLKDINNLFLDTGIGSNSYAIIALGMVDEILHDKENSRRKMLEQAAGISKYKMQKKEALSKLKSTESNLDRIEDLLFEITGNLKTLERQAKRTQKYFDIKEKYKELSIDLAKLKIADYKGNYKDLNTIINEKTDFYRTLNAELVTSESALEKFKKSNVDNELSLSEKQRKLNSLVGDIRRKEGDKNMKVQKDTFLQQTLTKALAESDVLDNQVIELKESIMNAQESLNQEKKVEALLEGKLDVAEKEKTKVLDSFNKSKEDLDSVSKELRQYEQDIFELEKKKAININHLENIDLENKRHKVEIEQTTNALGEFKKKSQFIDKELEGQRLKLTQYESAEEVRKQNEVDLRSQLDTIRQDKSKKSRILDAKSNEYDLVKSLVDKLEGFPESIKYLSQKGPKDLVLLSDLLYCGEEYRVAIENYLGDYVNYFVAESTATALESIQLLDKSQLGKANFFILDAIEDVKLEDSKVGVQAHSVLTVEDKYALLFKFLFKDVHIVDDDVEVTSLAKRDGGVYLSKSGRWVKGPNLLSGGSIGLFEGKKIGRKKSLELLQKDIKKLNIESEKIAAQEEKCKKNLEQNRQKINPQLIKEERNKLNVLEKSNVEKQYKIEGYQAVIQKGEERIQSNLSRLEKLNTSEETIQAAIVKIKTIYDALKNNVESKGNAFEEMNALRAQLNADYNAAHIEFIRQQNQVNNSNNELNFKEKRLVDVEAKILNGKRIMSQNQKDIEVLNVEIKDLTTSLVDLYEQKKVFAKDLSTFEQDYYNSRNKILELEEDVRKKNHILRDLQVEINRQKEAFNDLKMELSSIGERLKIEFEISVNDIINDEIPEGVDRDELEAKVLKIRNQIENFGEINPMAVTAYDEMNERFVTITTQRQDIFDAKESLLQTITEIEESATAKFRDAFEIVRANFQEVFRNLFTEDDNCDLILQDAENPLDSGISIIAKPKGKRPQSISQLSGGEKTLTATAFLFALYLYKPAPFCIFDEVDAPLDDANIIKFNRIIKKFSGDSQFIIITHNKLTMEAVDVIYGVYMEEEGVSGVNAVDLRSFKEDGIFQTVVEE